MNIVKSTRLFEDWLRSMITVVQADLDKKHLDMAIDPFLFLRATFYRWAQTFPKVCEHLMDAPKVIAVGDLHIENFGTWRDQEGRLIWGVNDLDEVAKMPYAIDLVRLLTSAKFAIEQSHLTVSLKDACLVVLEGYADQLRIGGRPFVLEEEHPQLSIMAKTRLRNPIPFWQKLDAQRAPRASTVPSVAIRALQSRLPEQKMQYRLVHRQAGEGSLGRQRFVALADYDGGRIARETKPALPSAWTWANHPKRKAKILINQVLANSVRCADPYLGVHEGWVVRRLAPSCARIELSQLPVERDEHLLLESMGREIANIHLGTPGAARAILADLRKRTDGWLKAAVKGMYQSTLKDHENWKKNAQPEST